LLAQLGIEAEIIRHDSVLTCDEADEKVAPLPGVRVKHLFVCNKRGDKRFLVLVHPECRVDLKGLAAKLDTGRLQMCSPERLHDSLGVKPGAVSVLSLINDGAHEVNLLVDEELWGEEAFLCHPLVNTATVVLAKMDLIEFLRATGHVVEVLRIPKTP